MSARQHRRARAAANAEATRRKLWSVLEGHVLGRWWRRLLAKLSKRYKTKTADTTGQLYRINLKRWAHNAHAAMHDPEVAEMQRVAHKLEKKRAHERLNRAAAERAMKAAAAAEGG